MQRNIWNGASSFVVMFFENRQDAGKRLATLLLGYREENPIVLALPRGGVPIGFEIAEVLHAPLEVLIVRKIGLSGSKEFAMGSIAENEVIILDEESLDALGIDTETIRNTVDFEQKELQRRVEKYRNGKDLPNMKGKTVILVDDGMATGLTARAGIASVKKLHPKKIVLATPVCAFDVAQSLRDLVDDFVSLSTPYQFSAISAWYKDFEQVSDEEVIELLKKTKRSNN